jgi:DNA-binding PadR family transcriptional regulator
MTKAQVLAIFARSGRFLTPDHVLKQLKPIPDRRSLYSYLARLQRQGLLFRHPDSERGKLAYILTARGIARLEYFQKKKEQIIAPSQFHQVM